MLGEEIFGFVTIIISMFLFSLGPNLNLPLVSNPEELLLTYDDGHIGDEAVLGDTSHERWVH